MDSYQQFTRIRALGAVHLRSGALPARRNCGTRTAFMFSISHISWTRIVNTLKVRVGVATPSHRERVSGNLGLQVGYERSSRDRKFTLRCSSSPSRSSSPRGSFAVFSA